MGATIVMRPKPPGRITSTCILTLLRSYLRSLTNSSQLMPTLSPSWVTAWVELVLSPSHYATLEVSDRYLPSHPSPTPSSLASATTLSTSISAVISKQQTSIPLSTSSNNKLIMECPENLSSLLP